MMTSGIVILLWCLQFITSNALAQTISPPTYATILAVITFAVATVGAYVQRGDRRHELLTTAVTLLLGLTTLFTVAGTGSIRSPYVVLWMLSGIFAALLGWRSLAPSTAMIGALGSYLFLDGQLHTLEWIIFTFTFMLPLVVSYLIWSQRFQAQDKTSAVTALAQELNQESNKSDIIVNAIGDGVIVTDGHGIITRINPAAQQIIGWGKEDALKLDYRSVLKIIDFKDALVTDELDPVQQSMKRAVPIITEKLGLRTVSGKKILASILVSPLGEPGSNSGTVIIFRDITTQHAEEREKAEFVSTASHEMRTPVAAIEGYLGLAINPNTATIDDRARSYLDKAHESAQHLGRLFQDLLDVSRLEDGRLNNNPVLVDISAKSRSILGDFTKQFQDKGLQVVFKPDQASGSGQPLSPIFYANVDPDHFREVYANLIENAIKYTKTGTVTIDVNGDEERVMVSVSDSGIGIPAEDISHLFQKFYRVDTTDTREIGGTGLGLYLSRRLTESMGGILSVDSEYGKGSTFTIEIPRLNKPAVDAALQHATEAPVQPQPALSPPAMPTPEQPVSPPTAAPQQLVSVPPTTQTPPAPPPPIPNGV